MKKMIRSMIRFCFGIGGCQGNSKENNDSVNEEYKEAFRTKSYTEICGMVHTQLEPQSLTSSSSSSSSSSSLSSSSSSSSSPAPINLLERMFEPHQERLTAIVESSNLHVFLVAYFEISLEASQTCESLLRSINQVWINNRSINEIKKLIRRAPPRWSNAQYHEVHRNLATFANRKSPFPETTGRNFHTMHNTHELLLHQLTSECSETKQKAKHLWGLRRALVIAGCSMVVITLVILSMHMMAGSTVAAPAGGIITCSLALVIMKRMKKSSPGRRMLGLEAQLDIAAKGVYILINNLDTISRLVQGLDDEMEHRRFAADICARKGKKNMEMVKEVVRKLEMHESEFVEQLGELESQIYLCFIDINRSRRLLVEEMFK